MSYLLISNYRKKCQLLLIACRPTKETVKKLISFSSFYIFYKEKKSREEQFFYVSNHQLIPLTVSKQDLKYLYQKKIITNQLEYEEFIELSSSKSATIALKTETPYDQGLTVQELRKKMRVIVKEANPYCDYPNELDIMLARSDPLGNQKTFVGFIKLAIPVIVSALLLMGYIGFRDSRQENLNILEKTALVTFFAGLVLIYLSIQYSTQNRVARKIEKILEKRMRIFSDRDPSFQKIRDNLKEYVIPPVIPNGIYMWKHPKSRIANKQVGSSESNLNF